MRKTVLLAVLALVWEGYARALDNPPLFPTLTATVSALRSARIHDQLFLMSVDP